MLVSELIKNLEAFMEVSGDTRVMVNADHGQCMMDAFHVGQGLLHKDQLDEYMKEPSHPDDVEDFDDYVLVCEIQG